VAVNGYLTTKDPVVDYIIGTPDGFRRTVRCGLDDVVTLQPGEKVLGAVHDMGIQFHERAPPIVVDSPPYDR